MSRAQRIVENLLDGDVDPKEFAIDTRDKHNAASQLLWDKGDITPETVRMLRAGNYVYHRTVKAASGQAVGVKITSIKTWVTRPDDFLINWKYGMRQYGSITPATASDWSLHQGPSQQELDAQKAARREINRQAIYNRDEPRFGESSLPFGR